MRKCTSLAAAGVIAAAVGVAVLLPTTANAAIESSSSAPHAVGDLIANSVPTTPSSYFGSGTAGETVTVAVTGMKQCSSIVGPNGQWSCVGQSLANGDHTADVSMSNGQSASIAITVDSRDWAPVYITGISGGTATRPVITGTAQPGARVRLSVDSLNVSGLGVYADGQGNWSVDPNQDITFGSHVFVATQTSQSPAFQSSSDHQELEVLDTPIVDPRITGVAAGLAGVVALAVVRVRRRRA